MLAEYTDLPYAVAANPAVLTYPAPGGLKLYDEADLDLLLEESDGTVGFEPVLGTHYTVSIARDHSFSITFLANTELTAGRSIVFDRTTAASQPSRFSNLNYFPGETTELQHDRAAARSQDQAARIRRAILARRGETVPELPATDDLAGALAYLKVDKTGWGLISAILVQALAEDLGAGASSVLQAVYGKLAKIEQVADLDVQVEALAAALPDLLPALASIVAVAGLGPEDLDALAAGLGVKLEKVASVAAVRAAPTSTGHLLLTDRLRWGNFRWDGSDLSAILTPHSVTTSSIDAGTDTLTAVGHGLYTGQAVYPTSSQNGLTLEQFYYAVRIDDDTFRLAASYEAAVNPFGAVIDLTAATNLTFKVYADPREGFYIVPAGKARDGSEGAFVRQVADDRLNPKMFGADQAAADNSAAFAAAANLWDNAAIVIPDGTWNFLWPVKWQDRVVTWEGSNQHNVVLQWDADQHGFYAGDEGRIGHSGICGVSFLTSVVATTAEAVYLLFTTNENLPAGIYKDMIIRGTGYPDTHAIKWWEYGLHLHNAITPHIENITASGSTGVSIVEIARANAAIYLTADEAAVAPKLRNMFLSNFNSGIKVRSSSSPAMEGLYIDHVDAILCNVGIDIVNSHPSYIVPQLIITNCEFECLFNTIYVEGYSEIVVKNPLSYLTNFGDTSPAHMHFKKCHNVKVTAGTLLSRPNNTSAKGILAEDCDRVDIDNNTISTQADHIAFTGTTQNSVERNNRFEGTGADFVDSSSNAATNRGGQDLTPNAWWHWEGEVLKEGGFFSGTTDGAGNLSVTYPKAFNTPFMPVICNGNGAVTTAPANLTGWTASGFTCQFPGYSGAATVNWQAAGK